jgi:hypothetical protein
VVALLPANGLPDFGAEFISTDSHLTRPTTPFPKSKVEAAEHKKMSLALIKATPPNFYEFLVVTLPKNSPPLAKNRPGSPDLDQKLRGLVLPCCQK